MYKGLSLNQMITLKIYKSNKIYYKQIRCKKDGFISIKLITSFKNIKKLTCDSQVVRCAIVRLCKSIVVSSDGLRVRRVNRLPDLLKKPRLLKTVLVGKNLYNN